ncbi:MAG: hypothetical protein E7634_07345 [Ruminococcaceae bacterium]|nr:hypothetical protein [Oscillospiraceae bacterium]
MEKGMSFKIPNIIESGYYKEGHVQGIAVDEEKGFVYYSFTTLLVKTDLAGNFVGSVKRLSGHLGCITFVPEKRMLYGSLEMKHDQIGRGIIGRTGWDPTEEDAFYIAGFDVDKIDRAEMDAENDGVMKAMYLREVLEYYKGTDAVSGKEHIYGCSGIDGIGYGPVFGAGKDSEKKLMVAAGIYGDTERDDNDNQLILQYSLSDFDKYARPLEQANPHKSGPDSFENKFFLYTGNTTYGVQNLEYDGYTGNWLVAVYKGKKGAFNNFPMFVIDGGKSPEIAPVNGRNGEIGNLLSLSETFGIEGNNGLRGVAFPYGQTGMASLGNGEVCFSVPLANKEEKTFASRVVKYKTVPSKAELFEEV